jgi:hypothetical protein
LWVTWSLAPPPSFSWVGEIMRRVLKLLWIRWEQCVQRILLGCVYPHNGDPASEVFLVNVNLLSRWGMATFQLTGVHSKIYIGGSLRTLTDKTKVFACVYIVTGVQTAGKPPSNHQAPQVVVVAYCFGKMNDLYMESYQVSVRQQVS